MKLSINKKLLAVFICLILSFSALANDKICEERKDDKYNSMIIGTWKDTKIHYEEGVPLKLKVTFNAGGTAKLHVYNAHNARQSLDVWGTWQITEGNLSIELNKVSVPIDDSEDLGSIDGHIKCMSDSKFIFSDEDGDETFVKSR